jgi:hypothetical protein
MRRRHAPWGGNTRAVDGCIVTLVNLDTGRTESRHLGGVVAIRRQVKGRRLPERAEVSVYELLRSLCEELDRREGDWRLRSVSTPTTILSDLRKRDAAGHTVPLAPELTALGKIGRLDLLEPRS